MKKLLVLIMVVFLVSCGAMEKAQWEKARIAEETGLPRSIRVYEQGNLVWEFKGNCNLEHSETSGFLTITEKRGENIYAHKIKSSFQTLMIIEELTGIK